ncbi:MAG: hypothetical protein JRI25_15995 [Deltaproteobacteria bacterium]|nr:hypothetical protein [Deltaproteobacteria bacterium]MBW2256083.1 hypothetical protein [Deltaproteobacteria bacterium]
MLPVAPPPPPPPPAWIAPHPCRAPAWRDGRPASIDSVTSDVYPLRVHWGPGGDPSKAAEILEYLELAWAVQVDQLGFRPPTLPDDAAGPELDVYLAPVGAYQAWVDPISWEDVTPGDGYSSAPVYVVIDEDLPEEWIPTYTVHEFNHVLQFATDFTETALNFWEATAVAAQKWTLDVDGRWDLDVPYFQEAPWAPTLVGDSYYLWREYEVGWTFEYGAALWMLHLDEVLGDGDGSVGPALWEAAANEGWGDEPDAVDAILAVSGQDLGAMLNGVARSRWLTGENWDARGLADAAGWDEERAVPIETELTAADLPVHLGFEHGPMITGQAFVTLDATEIDADLVIGATSSRGLQSGLLVLAWHIDGTTAEHTAVGTTAAIRLDSSDIERLVIAVSNLGPMGWDGSDYPYVPGDQVLHVRTDAEGEGTKPCGCDTSSPKMWTPFLLSPLVLARRRRVTPPQ